nr:thiol reductant ABC exporter subunit CydD [Motilibacter aurantiacus]
MLRRVGAARRFVALCVALGLAGTALILGQAVLLADVLADVMSDGAGLAHVRGSLGLLCLGLLARAVLAWGGEVAAARAGAAVRSELRRDLLRHALALGPGWLSGQRTGELTTLAGRGLDALDPYFARYVPQLVLAAVVPLAVGVRALSVDLTTAAVIGLTVPLVPVFMVLVGLATQRSNERRWKALSTLGGHFLDTVTGLPVLKAFGRSRAQAGLVRPATDRYRREAMATLRVAFLSSLVLELLSTLSVAMVAVLVGVRLVDGSLDLRTGLLVLLLAPEAYLPLRRVGEHYHASVEGMAAAQRACDLLAEPLPARGSHRDVPDPREAPVALRGVSLRHPGAESDVLTGLDLTLVPGTVTALVGPSGAGKSTVLSAVLGLLPCRQGAVTVGGSDLADVDREAWWERVAWVPQRARLVTGTVAQNLRLAKPGATDAELAEAAALALLDVPLDAQVGERGEQVSGGQRRRVALARALLRDASLVVLDEPTEGLDAVTEADVVRVLRRLRHRERPATVLLVTHRPALLALCDSVHHLGAPVRRPAAQLAA